MDSALELQRHRLVHLDAAAWQRIVDPPPPARPPDAQACACLRHWAEHDLPLVVTRQSSGAGLPSTGRIALGLPAPQAWGRRRIGVEVPLTAIGRTAAFPAAEAIVDLLPRRERPAWRSLCEALARVGATVRVHGSHGWQQLSGLAYLHPGSDIDLLVEVGSRSIADAAAALLQQARFDKRLDGELLFADGSAVAWREWVQWRSGRGASLLVKRLASVAMENPLAWAIA